MITCVTIHLYQSLYHTVYTPANYGRPSFTANPKLGGNFKTTIISLNTVDNVKRKADDPICDFLRAPTSFPLKDFYFSKYYLV